MRPRRDSRLGQNIFTPWRSSPPRQSIHHETASSSLHRHRGGQQNSRDQGSDDERENGQDLRDTTPLLATTTKAGDHRGAYGSSGRNHHSRRRSSRSSNSSRRRFPPPSREASFPPPGSSYDYDVNNPPSVPGSPKAGGDVGFDDVMVGGFAQPRLPDTRRDELRPRDTLIDIDDDEDRNGRVGSEPPSPNMDPSEMSGRRRGAPLPAEEDVCFPTEGMSETAEEDYAQHRHVETSQPRRRRRRMWPDLSILEEWSREEKEERSDGVRAMRVSEPVLVGGRLRPNKSGWHRTEEDAPYRFTYFNEEFQSTIHAQTISELVQPGSSFQELFIPDPPELTDSSSEDEDEEPTPIAEDKPMSPTSQTHSRHTSLLGDIKDSRETSGQATPQKTSQEKPKKYGPRPTFWLDVICPTDTEMRVISKAFGIHALTAEDIMVQEAREKVELFRNYYFINYRSFEQDHYSEEFLEPVNIYVVVFREGVISFHFSQTPHPANVRRRIRQLKDYLILSSDWISYAIIDDVTDVFQPLIQNVEEEVDDIDEIILRMHEDPEHVPPTTSKGSNCEKQSEAGEKEPTSGMDMLRRIGECRKKVMGLYRLLGNKADVIKGFAKRCNEQWQVAPKSEIGLYLGDIQDHIVTMTQSLGHYETLLSRAHSNYLAQVQIRMNDRAEKNADVLGKLTVLGTIVLPMNVICGMWGMNVQVSRPFSLSVDVHTNNPSRFQGRTLRISTGFGASRQACLSLRLYVSSSRRECTASCKWAVGSTRARHVRCRRCEIVHQARSSQGYWVFAKQTQSITGIDCIGLTIENGLENQLRELV